MESEQPRVLAEGTSLFTVRSDDGRVWESPVRITYSVYRDRTTMFVEDIRSNLLGVYNFDTPSSHASAIACISPMVTMPADLVMDMEAG